MEEDIEEEEKRIFFLRERKGKNEKTSRPTTDGETNVVTIHPVAPANYIMIFNGPKSKTRPPKIFGSGIDWEGVESSGMT